MTRPTRSAAHGLAAAASLYCALAGSLAGAAAPAAVGNWAGTYSCAQGVTSLDLSIMSAGRDRVAAVFHFGSAQPHSTAPEGCFLMRGTFTATTGAVALTPVAWLLQPPGYVMVGLQGGIAPDGQSFAGQVTGGFLCGGFTLRPRPAAPSLPAACAGGTQAVADAAAPAAAD